jgi:hypothetical protein
MFRSLHDRLNRIRRSVSHRSSKQPRRDQPSRPGSSDDLGWIRLHGGGPEAILQARRSRSYSFLFCPSDRLFRFCSPEN